MVKANMSAGVNVRREKEDMSKEDEMIIVKNSFMNSFLFRKLMLPRTKI